MTGSDDDVPTIVRLVRAHRAVAQDLDDRYRGEPTSIVMMTDFAELDRLRDEVKAAESAWDAEMRGDS